MSNQSNNCNYSIPTKAGGSLPHHGQSKLFQLEVMNTILRTSLEPSLLKDRLISIIAYLVNIAELNLSPVASIYLVEQDTNTLVRTLYYATTKEKSPECEQVQFGQCYCGRAAQSKSLQYVSSSANEHSSTHGHYCIPLQVDDRVIGVITFYTPKNHRRSELAETILMQAAGVLAALIESQKMDLQLTNLVNDLRNSISALRDERNFSESIIQGLQNGLIVTDTFGTIQKYNDAARTIFKWIPQSMKGMDLSELVGAHNREKILNQKSHEASPEGLELLIQTPDKSTLVLRYSTIARQLLNSDETVQIISFTDISKSWQVKREMEKMNKLSTVAEIASAVAHEVRNPLAGIKIMAQSIEENTESLSERIECSRRIIRQVDRLNDLLTDFFSYARPLQPRKQEASLQNILAETRPLIANKLERNRIHLITKFQNNLPTVIADPNQLQQVFLNLFLNAIDAIRQEGVIEITARKLNGNDLQNGLAAHYLVQESMPYVLVMFKDNGSGMNQLGVDRVFEPFFTTKTNGSGLGMSIVYRTLQENDASISVESLEGQGTTFSMVFKAGR